MTTSTRAVSPRLDWGTVLLLTVPPALWAGNVVVGRLIRDLISPMTLNFVRWVLVLLILLPMAHWVLRRDSPLWPHWRRYAMLGLLGIGAYNGLQYLALQSSTAMNVTLVGACIPLWMMITGTLFFGQRISAKALLSITLSIAGVTIVLSRGELQSLSTLRLVPGDLYMVLAGLIWALYSWLLMRTPEPASVRGDWAAFLFAQLIFGTAWSGLFSAGEWALTPAVFELNWTLAIALAFIAVGPALLAFRYWGEAVRRAGPNMAGLFLNLMPLFAALLSAVFLGEAPQGYHALAFLLIVGGILVSSRR